MAADAFGEQTPERAIGAGSFSTPGASRRCGAGRSDPVQLTEGVLLAVAFGFAISIEAHYIGACMGMPHAAGAIRPTQALLLMAPLAFLGAALASGGVETTTVGRAILRSTTVALGSALAIVTTTLLLTSAYHFFRIPTSTMQLLVFSTVGARVAAGVSVEWGTIGVLLVPWALAAFAVVGLGFVFVRVADRLGTRHPELASLAGAQSLASRA